MAVSCGEDASDDERAMSQVYPIKLSTTVFYLRSFQWGIFLRYIFNSREYLVYCCDEPSFDPFWNVVRCRREWCFADSSLKWIRALEQTCIWHRMAYNDARGDPQPKCVKQLSHLGGYLSD